LVSRITNLIEKYSDGIVQEISEADLAALQIDTVKFDNSVKEFRFHEALGEVWSWIAKANKIVDEAKLWELAKTDPDKFNAYAAQVVFIITQAAECLLSFTPETSKKILDHLALEKVTKMEPLFPRVN
jgi:methionyl-tRNA synthetase